MRHLPQTAFLPVWSVLQPSAGEVLPGAGYRPDDGATGRRAQRAAGVPAHPHQLKHLIKHQSMSNINNNTTLIIPNVPVIESSGNIMQTAAEIVDDFKQNVISFECYQILQVIILHFISSGGIDRVPDKQKGRYYHCMRTLSDTVFSLERHAQSCDAGTMIMKYMETVYKVDKEEMARVVGSLKEIDRKYSDLRTGLDSLLEYKDAMDREQHAEELST